MPAKRFDENGNRIIGIAKARNQRRKENWTKEQLEEKARKRQEGRRAKRARSFEPLTKEELELIKSGIADKSLKIRYAWQLNREKYCEAIRKTRSTKESRELTSKISSEMMSSEELRKNISEKEIAYCENPEVRERLRENSKKIFENKDHRKWISELSKKLWENPEIAEKRYNTMKKNNSFTKSQDEEYIAELLYKKFGKRNVIRQYCDPRYINPYNSRLFHCDFYIKSLDLFIEYQGTWTHGKEPFNARKKAHREIVSLWEKKAKEINFKGEFKEQFLRAKQIWTYRDPLKREIAKQNNLNWKEFFTVRDLKEWLKSI